MCARACLCDALPGGVRKWQVDFARSKALSVFAMPKDAQDQVLLPAVQLPLQVRMVAATREWSNRSRWRPRRYSDCDGITPTPAVHVQTASSRRTAGVGLCSMLHMHMHVADTHKHNIHDTPPSASAIYLPFTMVLMLSIGVSKFKIQN